MTVRIEAARPVSRETRAGMAVLAAWLRAHPLAVTVVAVVTVHIALGVWWLLRVRQPFVGTIDETQFLTAAWSDGRALHQLHPHALWDGYQSFTWFAPLLPLLTAPLLALDMSPVVAVLVELPLLAVVLASTALLGQRLGGRRAGVLATLLVASTPVFLDETRAYDFVLVSTATLLAATVALLLSNRLRRTGWSLAFGALVGLTALSRMMMLALLPPLLIAAILLVMRSSPPTRRLRNLVAAFTVAAAVACSWYLPHLAGVWHYLTSAGYGDRSTDYGTAHALFSWQFWTAKAALTARDYLDLPLTFLVLAALASAAAVAVRRLRPGRPSLRAWAAGHIDLLVVAAVPLAGYVVLSSSTNEGTGFEAPLLPFVMVLAAVALLRVATRWRAALLGLGVAAVAGTNVVFASLDADVRPVVNLPVLGAVPVVQSGGWIGTYMRSVDPAWWGATSAADRAAWAAAPMRLASQLSRYALAHGHLPMIWFGTSDRVVNFASISVGCLFGEDRGIPWMNVIDPTVQGDSVGAYVAQLGQANLLVTGDRGPGDFRPLATQAYVEQAARQRGFAHAFDFRLPDGRTDRIWWRATGPAAAPAGTVCGA